MGEACRWAEQHFGLTGTPARDRTAAKRPTRAESEKAVRAGRPEPSRTRLRREVQTVAAASRGGGDFLGRLADAGLLVRERRSEIDPGMTTGYAVALPGDRDAGGSPIWYGGGKLASDLSWQKLQRRWDLEPVSRAKPASSRDRVRLIGPARTEAWQRALRAAEVGAAEIRRLAATDRPRAADAAHATSDALTVTAAVVEGRRGGPLSDAAAAYDRASRELHGRTPRPTPTGHGLRAAARLLATTGRATRNEATQILALVVALAALTESVAALRDAQGRAAQATAARDTAARLRAVAPQPQEHQHQRVRSLANSRATAGTYPPAFASTTRGAR